ncbi:hypothetical protein [Actinomadura sp. 6N118]|uniref:hypothetical protein n=1 Tax=Actinomadura sp. 6N118 TaxID=3375151 RepID=UPI003790D0B8
MDDHLSGQVRVVGNRLVDLLILDPHELGELVHRQRHVARHVGAHGRIGDTTIRPSRGDARLFALGSGRTDPRLRVSQQCLLHGDRSVVPGARDGSAQGGVRSAGQ